MITAGLKLTGRGGIALIRDGRVELATSLSVPDENPSPEMLYDRAAKGLAASGYRIDGIEAWSVDCRHDTARTGVLPLGDTTVAYASRTHLDAQVAAAYGTSPFARDRVACTVLVWDSESFPHLYQVDTAGRVESRGELFPLTGSVLALAAQISEPAEEGLPSLRGAAAGAALADLAAAGTVRADVTALVGRLFSEYFEADTVEVKKYRANVLDCGHTIESSLAYTRTFLRDLHRAADHRGIRAADLATAFQLFLGGLLSDRLTGLLGDGAVDLCFTGSTAGSAALITNLREHPGVGRIWVPPYPDGSAVGTAAAYADGRLRPLKWDLRLGPLPTRTPHIPDGWSTSPCRPEEVARLVHRTGRPAVVLRGQLHAGPGSLGSRAILAPAVEPSVRDQINRATGRPEHRSGTALCLNEDVAEVFRSGTVELYAEHEQRLQPVWRCRLPVVARADGTARVRAVDDDPTLSAILREYREWSGVPVLAAVDDVYGEVGALHSVDSALEWGGIDLVWADGVLHRRSPLGRHDRTAPSRQESYR